MSFEAPPAQVRFFLPVLPPLPDRRTWSDVAYEYLGALVKEALPTLCLALNWSGDVGGGVASRWTQYRDLFYGRLADRYVNLVCGVGDLVTRNLNHGRLRHPIGGEILGDVEAVVASDPDLVRLFTVGTPNVAIVGGWPRPLVEVERKALLDYNVVVCPTETDARAINGDGGPKICVLSPVEHETFGGLLRSLLT